MIPKKKPCSCRVSLIAACCLVLTTAEATAQSEVHEKAIAGAYASWVKATNDKDLEKWTSFLAPDAIFLPADSPALTDREAILDYYRGLFADALFSLDCRQEQVEVAGSGDIAWASGRCQASFTGAEGRVAYGSSKWVKVWKRQPSGEWKCAANSWSSTAPAPKSGKTPPNKR